jgi:hypothetical protein
VALVKARLTSRTSAVAILRQHIQRLNAIGFLFLSLTFVFQFACLQVRPQLSAAVVDYFRICK